MRLSGLSFAAILLFSSISLAQHSSGGGGGSSSGGGSSGGGSSSGAWSGGGSHGGGGGSSGGSYSGGSHGGGGGSSYSSGHSSSASGLHGSAHGGSGSHGASNTVLSHTGVRGSEKIPATTVHPLNRVLQVRTIPPEKRSFMAFLRHPFKKPEAKTVIEIRHPCVRGHCPVCPLGQVGRGGACAPARFPLYTRNVCSRQELWAQGTCFGQTVFFDPCADLRVAFARQENRLRAAQSEQHDLCEGAVSQACSDATAALQKEESDYRTLQERYGQCRLRGTSNSSLPGTFVGRDPGLLFDPMRIELEY